MLGWLCGLHLGRLWISGVAENETIATNKRNAEATDMTVASGMYRTSQGSTVGRRIAAACRWGN